MTYLVVSLVISCTLLVLFAVLWARTQRLYSGWLQEADQELTGLRKLKSAVELTLNTTNVDEAWPAISNLAEVYTALFIEPDPTAPQNRVSS